MAAEGRPMNLRGICEDRLEDLDSEDHGREDEKPRWRGTIERKRFCRDQERRQRRHDRKVDHCVSDRRQRCECLWDIRLHSLVWTRRCRGLIARRSMMLMARWSAWLRCARSFSARLKRAGQSTLCGAPHQQHDKRYEFELRHHCHLC